MVDFKKIGAVVVSGALVGGLGMVAGANLFPKTVVEYVDREVLVPVEVPYEVEVEVPVEVERIVEVDNENLNVVLDFVYEYNGDVEFVLEGLDDDELDRVVDRIVFVHEVEAMIIDEVRAEWRDLVDRRWADDGRRIYSDVVDRVRFTDDVAFSIVDFDYEDAEGTNAVRFRMDDATYEAEFRVEIKDGRVDRVRLVGDIKLV